MCDPQGGHRLDGAAAGRTEGGQPQAGGAVPRLPAAPGVRRASPEVQAAFPAADPEEYLRGEGAERDEAEKQRLVRGLDRFLLRPGDREPFGMEPKGEA